MNISSTEGSINNDKQREGQGFFLIFTMAILGLLTIGLSTGPVIASLIIGPFGDPATGYAFAWGHRGLARVGGYSGPDAEQAGPQGCNRPRAARGAVLKV